MSATGAPVRFGAAAPQGRILSVALVVFGALWLYPQFFAGGGFAFDFDRGAKLALLFCAVCWALAVVCWNWQAYLAVVEIDDEGMTITGHGISRHFDDLRLAWEEIAAFEAMPGAGKGASGVLRIVIHPQPGRASDYPLVLSGLRGNVRSTDIVGAAEERFTKAGYRLSEPWKEPGLSAFRAELLRA